jgi:hypothetical protein
MNTWPPNKYFESVSHYGDFSTGYITLIKPDLYEVAEVLAKSLKLEELSKFDRIYVTTHTDLATPKIERSGYRIVSSSTTNILSSTFHFVTHQDVDTIKSPNTKTIDNSKKHKYDSVDGYDGDNEHTKKVKLSLDDF